MAADSKNLERTLTESAFSQLTFPLCSLFSCFKLWQTFIEVYLRKQEFPNLSHLLPILSPAIIWNNKTLNSFSQEQKKKATLSKRFVTMIDYRLQKNKITLKEKSYRQMDYSYLHLLTWDWNIPSLLLWPLDSLMRAGWNWVETD